MRYSGILIPGILFIIIVASNCATFDEQTSVRILSTVPEGSRVSDELLERELCKGTEEFYGSGIPSLRSLLGSVEKELTTSGYSGLSAVDLTLYAKHYKLGSMRGDLALHLCWRISGYPTRLPE